MEWLKSWRYELQIWYAVQIHDKETIQKFAKLGQMEKQPVSRDLLLNFGIRCINATNKDRDFKFGM